MRIWFAALLGVLILWPRWAASQTEDVTCTGAVGVQITGNSLSKNVAVGWGNSGAVSTQSLSGNGFVEFTANETNTYRILGLGQVDSDQSYTDVDFGIYLDGSNGSASVYESGSYRTTFGSYSSGDRFRVEVAFGLVRYRRNGTVLYTSLLEPRFPLRVDTALYTTGATLADVKIGRGGFTRDVGVLVANRTLTKTGAGGWNAGAVSAQRILWGDGYLEFTATETNKRRAAGLSRGDSDQSLTDIDFALVLNANATVEIQEGGVSQGTFGSYSSNDRFRVEVSAGAVKYYRNGGLLFTSSASPFLPLLADTAFDDTGSTLTDVVVGDLIWTNASGVSTSGNSLVKTGSAGWNAGAASTASFASGEGFVEFSAVETNTNRMCGLGHDDTGYDDADIDFAIRVTDTASVQVYESGTLRGSFGTYAPGDRFRVEVQAGTVKYRKNGVVFYTSAVSPTYPLAVDTSLDTPGATLGEVQFGRLVWKNDVGVSVQGYGLIDTAASGWGNAGAASSLELASGDGYVEFTAVATNTNRMIGLSKGDTNQQYTEIDYAIFLVNGSQLGVYENGSFRGYFGSYAPGDRFRVGVEGGVVKYRKNGDVFYPSAIAPQYPLLIDTSFNETGSSIADIDFVGPLGPAAVASPTFSPIGGGYTTTQSVTLSCGTPGADIYYTTDGSEPTQASLHYQGGTISIAVTTTLKAKAWKSGLPPSDTGIAVYTLTVPTPTLTASPGGASPYNVPQDVTIACSLAGAVIRYTTDGSTPTTSSPQYSSPVHIAATTTLTAKAWNTGWVDSSPVSATYTMKGGKPTFSPPGGTYAGAQTVTVSTVTPNATIHYTTNGVDPTATDPTVASGGSVAVGQSLTLKASVWATGWTTSDVAVGSYFISLGTVATPTMTPAPGSFTGTQTVTLATATPGSIIRYTVDGTTPGMSSPIYGAPLTLADTTTIKALAYKPDWSPSALASGTYTLTTTAVATPTTQPGSGTYPAATLVTIACTTPDATLRYTTTGADPTTSDQVITSGSTVLVDRSLTLKVKAWKTGMADSAVRRSDYVLVGAVAAGGLHTLALKGDGTVWGWGYNNPYGAVGDGTIIDRYVPVQVMVSPGNPLTGVTALSAAGHSLAIKDGRVWAWGANNCGQLGDGTWNSRSAPYQITNPNLTNVIAVAAGGCHSLVVRADGTVWAWGGNTNGQLGDGTTNWSNSPVAVVGLTGVTSVSAGSNFSMALKTDGAASGYVWTWGMGDAGQLGDGSPGIGNQQTKPIRILSDAIAISAGHSIHALAVKSDGTTWGWGYNLYGQVDGGTVSPRPTPVQVVGFSGAQAVAGGNGHSLALTNNGVVWAWGNNGNGQLGDGSFPTSNIAPVWVFGVQNVLSVSAGDSHSAALAQDGSVWTWGANQYGQLGDGTAPNGKMTPVKVLQAVDDTWLDADPDNDGLTNRREFLYGCDPMNPDTNGDGLPDGAAIAAGLSCSNPDMDGDGLTNVVERQIGTDPFKADTDGDGVPDGTDCFPLDRTRWQCPPPDPNDHTPPAITLTEPTNATLVGSVPP